ncbi:MAG: hypothetical protein HYT16_00845 [DPANN group archaeon]|nr:hypothetical protein [DPANN group archaeon]
MDPEQDLENKVEEIYPEIMLLMLTYFEYQRRGGNYRDVWPEFSPCMRSIYDNIEEFLDSPEEDFDRKLGVLAAKYTPRYPAGGLAELKQHIIEMDSKLNTHCHGQGIVCRPDIPVGIYKTSGEIVKTLVEADMAGIR